MEDSKILLSEIKYDLERMIDKEWPKLERVIDGHEERIRRVENFQIRLDDFLPRIDSLVQEIKKNSESYARAEDLKKMEIMVSENAKQIDMIKSYIWKAMGAIAILAFMVPITLKFV